MAAKLRKGDKVVVLAGKDKGKEGTIESVNPSANKAVVDGINMAIQGDLKKRKSEVDNWSNAIRNMIEAEVSVSKAFWFPKQVFEGQKKVIVNVGSVGQPRDHDIRSCYVVIDGDTVTFRRVSYDVEAVYKKIKAVDRLPNSLANRLKKGV